MTSPEQAYTCVSCYVAFITAEHQRSHYRTDWHRYNLKRKVAQLPPVSSDLFAQRMLWMQREEEAKQNDVDYCYTCKTCQKTFSNENTYSNHVQSKKHKEKVKQQQHQQQDVASEQLSEAPSISLDSSLLKRKRKSVERKSAQPETLSELPEWDLSQCLFCKENSTSMENNLDHMTTAHSFYIPEPECLIDLPGFLTYLGQKVSLGHACLFCNTYESVAGLFETAADARRHMIDKSHCTIRLGDGLEYEDFYDFSAMWSTDEEGDVNEDDEAEAEAAIEVDEAMQLVLPNGKSIGHRQLKRYYKQNHLHDMQIVAVANKPVTVPPPLPSAMIIHRFKDEWMRLGMKANKLQKHFREQVMY